MDKIFAHSKKIGHLGIISYQGFNTNLEKGLMIREEPDNMLVLVSSIDKANNWLAGTVLYNRNKDIKAGDHYTQLPLNEFKKFVGKVEIGEYIFDDENLK